MADSFGLIVLGGLAFLGLIIILLPHYILGLVIIGERQVGVVIKKMSWKSLPDGQFIALNGEAGYQADTLSPGWHTGYWPFIYRIIKAPVTIIPQGEIGLVVSADGAAIPPNRILGRVVPCDNYQNARDFLVKGGEKGRQLGILTGGTYRINPALFTVITAKNAAENGMHPDLLKIHYVAPDKVGIVTMLDGEPIEQGEIAGPIVPGHDNFQNAQKFIANGGRRGLQEQILLSGSWNLNPWIVRVEQVPMTSIPIGYVGVVISFVGKAHEDVSGDEFKHGDLVNPGHKGVWVNPLYPGKQPINTKVMDVELVPTTNIVLNWARQTESHQYDAKLSSITVRSRDGFAFNLDVSQIIHVGALDAPKVISRVGSMQNLVDHVLQPIVGNYFRNAAQDYTVLDFLIARSERQEEASRHIAKALAAYDVQAIDTLIGDINPPEDLMVTLTDRKIAEEQRKTYVLQQEAQNQRQQLVRETAMADIQHDMVKAEQGVSIAGLEAEARVKQATGDAQAMRLQAAGEAEAIRVTGMAKAQSYKLGAQALGPQGYTALLMMEMVGKNNVRITPDVSVSSSNGHSGGLLDALLGMTLRHNGQNGDLDRILVDYDGQVVDAPAETPVTTTTPVPPVPQPPHTSPEA